MKKKILIIALFLIAFTFAFTASAYNFGNVTLKDGSRGEAVMELQRFLNANLNLGLVIDGKLGPKTISVIKKWQKDNGLKDDGLIGEKTKIKMNSIGGVISDTGNASLNKPTLSLLYPNGGEAFKGGDQVTIKWTGTNVSNISFVINLKYYDKDNNFITDQELAYFVPASDNQKVVMIPTTLKQVKNVYKVSKYKISIGKVPAENSFPGDISDNFFTINRLPNIGTEYATQITGTSAELTCIYKYQFGTDNPEITFEYGENPCPLTNIDGSVTPSCVHSSKIMGTQTYFSEPVLDTTERTFTAKYDVSNLKLNTQYNYQCIVKNNNGQIVGYDKSSPTTYVQFNTTQ